MDWRPKYPAISVPSVSVISTKHGSVVLKIQSHPVGIGLMVRSPSQPKNRAKPSRWTIHAASAASSAGAANTTKNQVRACPTVEAGNNSPTSSR